MNSIWQRHFFVELMKVFVLFVASFFFVYVLIDYSVHTKAFQANQISFPHLIFYYSCQFSKRAELLVPIALMVATINVLSTANGRNELVALASGGISLKKILSPFLWAALLLSALLYLNIQFMHPLALNEIDTFEKATFKASGKESEVKKVNALLLEDGSLLLYQSYDPASEAFFDLFWLQGSERFCRIKFLHPHVDVPYGEYIDFLERTEEGEIKKIASCEILEFPDMRFDSKTLFSAVHPPRQQSLSQLARSIGWKQAKFGIAKMNDREAESVAFFYFKLLSPLLCFFAVLAPAPFCLRFTRNLPVFMIYALSIFAMISFFTFINSSVILGESQVLPPIIAIALPQTTVFMILGWKYAKL